MLYIVVAYTEMLKNVAVLASRAGRKTGEKAEHQKLYLYVAYSSCRASYVFALHVSLTLISSVFSGAHFHASFAGPYHWNIENGCHSRRGHFYDKFQESLYLFPEPSASSRCLGFVKLLDSSRLGLAEPI